MGALHVSTSPVLCSQWGLLVLWVAIAMQCLCIIGCEAFMVQQEQLRLAACCLLHLPCAGKTVGSSQRSSLLCDAAAWALLITAACVPWWSVLCVCVCVGTCNLCIMWAVVHSSTGMVVQSMSVQLRHS